MCLRYSSIIQISLDEAKVTRLNGSSVQYNTVRSEIAAPLNVFRQTSPRHALAVIRNSGIVDMQLNGCSGQSLTLQDFLGLPVSNWPLFDMWVLDGQAPNVNVITYCSDNIVLAIVSLNYDSLLSGSRTYHETSVHTDGQTQTSEEIGDLAGFAPKNTLPKTEQGRSTVQHTQSERDNADEDTGERKIRFDQVCHDHVAHSVGVDQAH